MLSNDDEAWPISVNALRVLAEAATLIDPVLTIAQRQAFAGAAKSTIRTVIDNAGEADELNLEAGEVETLEKILGQSLGSLAANLRERANELEERHADRDSSDPEEYRYLSESVEEFDIDGLFDGLMDR
ncbi:MAG: hypothetical protein ACRED0_12825 [Gammaproteobacteria bacterium]